MQLKLSRLGFGLAGIAGSGNFSHQQTLVMTAIDCGVTHFDTAPYYGSGDAERILGDVLAKHTGTVTISTKFGLVALSGGRMGGLARTALRPLFRRVRSLKTLAAKMVSNVHKPAQVQEHIQKSSLVESLAASTRKLRRPVDLFLLHEATMAMARDPAVIEGLTDLRASGQTRCTGISGASGTLLQAIAEFPKVYEVAQTENSLVCPAPMPELLRSGSRVITHRAIQGGLNELVSRLNGNADFKRLWLRETGVDPSAPDLLAQVLVELALIENPEGTVLFSTTRPERIKAIARALHSPVLNQEAAGRVRRLFESASRL